MFKNLFKRKKKSQVKKLFILFIILIIVGQVIFALFSSRYTTPHYQNKIYATIGVKHDTSDLHKLNEAAHYFGQTIIGWTKFPNFTSNLIAATSLPNNSAINAHLQERQNIIFTICTTDPIKINQLITTKDYIQNKINEYNQNTRTQFILTNLDYEQKEIHRSYIFGTTVALFLSIAVGLAILFILSIFRI